jgi:uridine kinase
MEKVAEQGSELMVQVRNLSELVDKVNESSKKCGQTKIIVIDGPAGSGKTTLAKSLSGLLENCPIIHMDEIYDGWENALSPKTSQDLVEWIINPLLESRSIEFVKYDWYLEKRIEKVVINLLKVLIIEGVGSSSFEISKHASLKLWIEVNKETGINRVLTRDGQQIQEQMKKWQSQESKFFIENNSKENSDIWIDGDPVVKIDTSSQFVRTNR